MAIFRFAPSPTGFLHLGGLRTALFNHLYAKKLGGKWIVRIEDTDTARTIPGSVENITRSLEWAGLHYDFGPDRPGPHGPYFQSDRRDLYKAYTQKLIDTGHAYHCFCTPDRLASVKERLSKMGSNATYDKNCLHLTEEEVARRIQSGERSVVRLNSEKVPSRSSPTDLVFGELKDSHLSLPTDPILLKSDLFPTYHLASVVDDHEMGITHVLRGEEWLPSLPLHLDLYACFRLSPPQYAHLPLLLNADGSKMSKRKGDVRVVDFAERGWEPVALLNWLAQSGRGPIHTSESAVGGLEAFSLPQLIDHFDLSAYTSRRTILDPGKLQNLNKSHLSQQIQTESGLISMANRVEFLCRQQFPDCEDMDKFDFREISRAFEGRLTNINEAPDLVAFLFQHPDYQSEEAKRLRKTLPREFTSTTMAIFYTTSSKLSSWDRPNLQSVLAKLEFQSKLKHKEFMSIFRYVLTGKKTGLGVLTTLRLLGREKTYERIEHCIGQFQTPL